MEGKLQWWHGFSMGFLEVFFCQEMEATDDSFSIWDAVAPGSLERAGKTGALLNCCVTWAHWKIKRLREHLFTRSSKGMVWFRAVEVVSMTSRDFHLVASQLPSSLQVYFSEWNWHKALHMFVHFQLHVQHTPILCASHLERHSGTETNPC